MIHSILILVYYCCRLSKKNTWNILLLTIPWWDTPSTCLRTFPKVARCLDEWACKKIKYKDVRSIVHGCLYRRRQWRIICLIILYNWCEWNLIKWYIKLLYKALSWHKSLYSCGRAQKCQVREKELSSASQVGKWGASLLQV